MKKPILFLIAALLGLFTANAQGTLLCNPSNRIHSGIRVAAEITCPGDVTMDLVGVDVFANGGGVELGWVLDVPVVANFYVELGVKFYYNTYSVSKEFLASSKLGVHKIAFRKLGMRVPVMLGYHFDFTDRLSLHLLTGPELEIGFEGNERVVGGDLYQDYEYGEFGSQDFDLYSDEGGMRRFDLLWGVGAGVSIGRFYVGLGGSMGLCNMVKMTGVKFRENRVSLTLGYNL